MPKIHTEPEGRICDATGCATVLSVYNAKHQCWAHENRPDTTGEHSTSGRRGR